MIGYMANSELKYLSVWITKEFEILQKHLNPTGDNIEPRLFETRQ